MDKKRNGAIDLLKFLFCLMIVLYHGRIFAGKERPLFGAGYIAVEFFFLVSGYLMTAKAFQVSRKENLLVGKETTDFILKKVKTILPHILFAYIVCIFVILKVVPNPKSVVKGLPFTVWEPFMLWMSGLGSNKLQINAQTWYISAMLLSMFVLYPIMILRFDTFTHVIAPITSIFLLGWIAHEYGHLNHYINWSGHLYSGNIRALACLSLGTVCWTLSQWLQNLNFTKLGKVLLSLIEIGCYGLVCVGANYEKHKMLGFVMIALLAIGIAITFSKKSLTGTCFDHKFFYWLGNFSLTVYLNHIIIRKIFQKNDLGMSYKKELLIFIAAALGWSLVAHFIMQGLLKLGAKLGTKLKNALVESEEVAPR